MSSDLYHVRFGVCQRTNGGDALKLAAYQRASRIRSVGGRTYDFTRKAQEHVGHLMLTPECAPSWTQDPAEVWRRAELAESRVNAQTARIVEFAIPRSIAPTARSEFAAYVLRPLADLGMVLQVDLHCPKASDGLDQPHAHALLSLRRIEGDGFASRKERDWNRLFQANRGKDMHAMLCGRMNHWLALNGYETRLDHRSYKERGVPNTPEPTVPKWQFEKFRRTGDAPDALYSLLALRSGRRRGMELTDMLAQTTRAASQAKDTIKNIEGNLRAAPGLRPSSQQERQIRRQKHIAGILRRHYQTDWLPPSVARKLQRVDINEKAGTAMLLLKDGTRFVDFGDKLVVKSAWSKDTITELAEAAARRAWVSVEVSGSEAFRDEITIALALRRPPIAVLNHVLSASAQQRLDAAVQAGRVLQGDLARAAQILNSEKALLMQLKRRTPTQPPASQPAPSELRLALTPSWGRRPKKANPSD